IVSGLACARGGPCSSLAGAFVPRTRPPGSIEPSLFMQSTLRFLNDGLHSPSVKDEVHNLNGEPGPFSCFCEESDGCSSSRDFRPNANGKKSLFFNSRYTIVRGRGTGERLCKPRRGKPDEGLSGR